MSSLPSHWTPKEIATFSEKEWLFRVVSISTSEIERLKKMKRAAQKRLKELDSAEYRYAVRMYYVHETDRGAHGIGHMAYYGVSVIKYPVVKGVVQTGVVVEPTYRGDSSNQIYFYDQAFRKFRQLCEKYKEYDPVCVNEVPEEYRGDVGDL